jgi:hypothetical protein
MTDAAETTVDESALQQTVSTSAQPTYDAFISYSHRSDRPVASALRPLSPIAAVRRPPTPAQRDLAGVRLRSPSAADYLVSTILHPPRGPTSRV